MRGLHWLMKQYVGQLVEWEGQQPHLRLQTPSTVRGELLWALKPQGCLPRKHRTHRQHSRHLMIQLDLIALQRPWQGRHPQALRSLPMLVPIELS